MPENFRVSRTRRIVKKSMLLALPLILALLATPAIPQGTKNNYPTPPPPLNSTTGEKEPATLRRRVRFSEATERGGRAVAHVANYSLRRRQRPQGNAASRCDRKVETD